jgi:hypothetical protein
MSETLPVPVDRLCRAVGRKREPCRNNRSEGSDYCYRHQGLTNKPASGNEGSPVPFPEVGDPEELTTPAGIHAYMARIAEEREELEVVAEEQRQLREAAEKNLAAHLDRLRKAHNTLCYGCGVRLRPLIGGEPQPGDIDHVERTEYIGRTGWG